jgi:hypothetical protein
MKNEDLKILIFIILVIISIMLFICSTAFAKSGVDQIIENDTSDDFHEFNDGGVIFGETSVSEAAVSIDKAENKIIIEGYAVAADNDKDTSLKDYIKLDYAIDKMRNAVSAVLGKPNALPLILLLFALAALIQIARVVAGNGDWVSFVVRVIVVLAALKGFTYLFSGVEVMFKYFANMVLGGQGAYDILWKAQIKILSVFTEHWNQNYDPESKLSIFSAIFSKATFMYLLVIISYIASYAMYTFIYLVQACFIIALEYLGPILIALAIIPETDYTGPYLSGVFQIQSWTLVTAFLLKIMSTIPEIGLAENIQMKDFIAIIVMNVCFAFAFKYIPTFAETLFPSSRWSSLGNNAVSFGGSVTKMATAYLGLSAKPNTRSSIQATKYQGNGFESSEGAQMNSRKDRVARNVLYNTGYSKNYASGNFKAKAHTQNPRQSKQTSLAPKQENKFTHYRSLKTQHKDGTA